MTDDERDTILDTAWAMLETGVTNRKSAAHHPVVASMTAEGDPDQRVMILRAADRTAATLRFHTDARSPKAAQIDLGASVHVLIYDAEAKVQLRLSGIALIETGTPAADDAWAASTTFARRCYMAEAAPGTPLHAAGSGLPAWIEGQQPTEVDVAPARPNFAIMEVSIARIDWLYLANSGHRRARLCFDAGGWSGQWLVP